jgi:hypothetical protein
MKVAQVLAVGAQRLGRLTGFQLLPLLVCAIRK